MTILPLYGGPAKRDIIQRAYGFCGQASYEFELSPEEYVVGLRAMNDQLATLPTTTGYNMPAEGDGSADDFSGIAQADVLGVSYFVAQLLAPTIGKQLAGNKIAIRASDVFLAKYKPIPFMEMGRHTIRGAGNRRFIGYGMPYFAVDISDDEIVQ